MIHTYCWPDYSSVAFKGFLNNNFILCTPDMFFSETGVDSGNPCLAGLDRLFEGTYGIYKKVQLFYDNNGGIQKK